jgi:hypothetical protein
VVGGAQGLEKLMALKNSMGGMISQVSRMISPPGEQDLSEQVGWRVRRVVLHCEAPCTVLIALWGYRALLLHVANTTRCQSFRCRGCARAANTDRMRLFPLKRLEVA